MEKKTFYAIYHRGHIATGVDAEGYRVPLLFQSKGAAETVAEERTLSHKRVNTIKKISL